MAKTKILLYVKDGNIEHVISNEDVEIEMIINDSCMNSYMTQPEHTVHKEDFDHQVKEYWKAELERHFNYDEEVKAQNPETGEYFTGRAMDGVQTDKDGNFYVNVKNEEGKTFDIDVMSISLKTD